MQRIKNPKITHTLLNWLAQETERSLDRLGQKKLYKVTKPRDADSFTVSFYGYSAYIALREFEKRLRATGIAAELVRTGKDRQASVSIQSHQGGNLVTYTPHPKNAEETDEPGESAQ
jgi:hypothetical protein